MNVYRVLKAKEYLNVGDEVIITEEEGFDLVGVKKITRARRDNVIVFDDRVGYWMTCFTWIDMENLQFIREEK